MREQIDKRVGVGSAFCLEDFLRRPLGGPEFGAAHHDLFEGAGFDGIQGLLNRVLVLLLTCPFAGTFSERADGTRLRKLGGHGSSCQLQRRTCWSGLKRGKPKNHIAVFSQLQSVYVLFTRSPPPYSPRLFAQFTLGLAC